MSKFFSDGKPLVYDGGEWVPKNQTEILTDHVEKLSDAFAASLIHPGKLKLHDLEQIITPVFGTLLAEYGLSHEVLFYTSCDFSASAVCVVMNIEGKEHSFAVYNTGQTPAHLFTYFESVLSVAIDLMIDTHKTEAMTQQEISDYVHLVNEHLGHGFIDVEFVLSAPDYQKLLWFPVPGGEYPAITYPIFSNRLTKLLLNDAIEALMKGKNANEGKATMGLILKGFDGKALVAKIGVPTGVFESFCIEGGSVHIGINSIVLELGAAKHSIEVSLAALKAAKTGTLPVTAKKFIQFKLKKALESMMLPKEVEPNLPKMITAKPILTFGEKFKSLQANAPSPPGGEHLKYAMTAYELGGGGNQEIAKHNAAVTAKAFDSVKKMVEKTKLKAKSEGELKKWSLTSNNVVLENNDLADIIAKQEPTFVAIDLSKPAQEVTVVNSSAWDTFPVEEMHKAPLVSLMQATRLYQPVKATTPNKRYYVIAISPMFRIAARYSPIDGEISVRIEGKDFVTNGKLVSGIFKNYIGVQEYSSFHVAVADDLTAGKFIGAILAGLDQPWQTPVPSIKIIKGK